MSERRKHVMHSAVLLSLGWMFILSACAEKVPPQVATYPYYERGIDQDISATRDSGSTLETLSGGANAPWRLNQY
jgi:hypothetical protein